MRGRPTSLRRLNTPELVSKPSARVPRAACPPVQEPGKPARTASCQRHPSSQPPSVLAPARSLVRRRLPDGIPFRCPPTVAETFARQVEQAADDALLRYSQRMTLLRQAEHMGIGRFEANLIIAVVQHQIPHSSSPRTQRRPLPLWTLVGLALAAEALLLITACRFLLT